MSPSRARSAARAVLVAAAYAAAGKLGLALNFVEGNVSPVWPAAGIAVATAFLLGRPAVLGVAAGTFAVTLTTGVPVAIAAAFAVGNGVACALAAALLRRLDFDRSLSRMEDALALLAATAAAALVAAITGAVSLWAGGLIPLGTVWPALRVWWLGDAVGLVIVAPAILLATDRSSGWWTRRTALAAAAGAASTWVIVGDGRLPWAIVPFILWAALSGRPAGTAAFNLGVAVVAVPLTIRGSASLPGAEVADVYSLDGFLAVICCSGLVLAAVTAERDRGAVGLRRSEALFESAFSAAPMGVVMVSTDGIYLQVNEAYASMLGYRPEQLVGRHYQTFTHPDERESAEDNRLRLTSHGEGTLHTERRLLRADGGIAHVLVNTALQQPDPDEPPYFLSLVQDITARKAAEDALTHQAVHDPLTGLANRTRLLSELDRQLGTASRSTAVVFVDLDRFKGVNDRLGHDGGDQVLLVVAERLRSAARSSDTIGRLGGDEFVVVAPCDPDGVAAHALADRFRTALASPITVDAGTVTVTASVGVAIGESSADPDELLAFADEAMYVAKQQGRDRVAAFDEGLRARTRVRRELERDLVGATDRGELVPHFQPIRSTISGAWVGAEALLRWQHPTRGLLPTAAFVPVAEDSGLIAGIGAWSMRASITEAGRWERSGPPAPQLWCNVSATELTRTGFLDALRDDLAQADLPASRLVVELTESALVRDFEPAIAVLAALRDLGAGIALDDFGVGASSLGQLKAVPADVLKLDRSFVAGLGMGGDDEALVASIVAMGHELGLLVLAEGVEDDTQLDAVYRLGIDLVQGFGIARPCPASELPPPWPSAVLAGRLNPPR